GSFRLDPENEAVERVLPAAHDRKRQRDDEEQEFEFPPGRVRLFEFAMGFGDEERDRAEHHDHEAEGGELGEEAEDHAQGPGGLGHYASSEELDAYLRIVAARAQSRLGIAQLE